jgi:CRP/FNR family cyclic AMP-dependent transcriptional regulator
MEDAMVIEQLKKQQVFEFLRPDQIDTLSNTAEVIRLKAGQSVYHRGDKADYLYVILSGEVALRMRGKGGVSILIDELTESGSMFGACISPSIDTCVLTARCEQDTELLKIEKSVLKRLLDDDPRMGYAIQSKIAEIYFKRYIEATRKLQAIIMNIPIELD